MTTGGTIQRGFIQRLVRGLLDRRRLAAHECRGCRGWIDTAVDTPWGRVCSDECAWDMQAYYAW